jgi:Permuted papain-like amidase enzyme, YaeF/YiiX, C92 family
MGTRTYAALLALILSCGCATPGVVVPPAAELKSARDSDALAEIRRVGRNGDWIVIRGYHATDNLVAVATNTPWTHAAILDLGKGEVIEAEAQGVHISPLEQFVARAHRLLLVRPSWANDNTSGEALLKARSLVGKGYDFLGLVGINDPERYYCSELAIAVYRPYIPTSERIPRPVAPGQLHYWGRILYDSGNPPMSQ